MNIIDPKILIAIASVLALLIALPAVIRWVKTVRCPKCKKWFKLDFLGFVVRDKAVGHSSTSFGGGVGVLGRLRALVFGHATRTNADPFIREWGIAHFTCSKCGCKIEIDSKRDRK